ncbi:hypothetical protein LAZ67_20001248 [Cordylochernes scorpioides]|uniref:Uncharacterized protein n=1 Tax=Cordylochernes scorpioides TaxID=51811 RepID=A0ABY6LKR9_9ARAC|nr:hypothetical protein LAZ67_20001248 [Cordylochernes scorpioides]
MRQEFAAWVLRQIDIDENWLSNVLWTDDAHFSLNGAFNIQNSRIWATENPRIFTEMPLYQPRVTVLAKALSEITFMKDGGPPHISRGAKQLLKDTFGENRMISHHFIYQWPPRSPDLTPCDFCLWGCSEYRSASTDRPFGTSEKWRTPSKFHHTDIITFLQSYLGGRRRIATLGFVQSIVFDGCGSQDQDRKGYIETRREYLKLLERKRNKFNKDRQEKIKNAIDPRIFWSAMATLRKRVSISGDIKIED